MRARIYVTGLLVGILAGIVTLDVGATLGGHKAAQPVGRSASQAETVCITNRAQGFISDKKILNEIPAWQHALNVDFASYWHTTPYRLVFLGRKPAPFGCISAVFLPKGPITGALAYHWTERNNLPSITVYAGTGAYYGFDNSVSMTHELFELAADPNTSLVNQGYPDPYYYTESPGLNITQYQVAAYGWFNEVADPVEADTYTLPGADGRPVRISDFVTPAWFNDGTGDRFDFLGLCQQPFWIRPGGYAQFFDVAGWHIVTNFRRAHPSDRGFLFSDPKGRA